MRVFAVAAVAVALAACAQTGTGVMLTVDAAGLAPDALEISATYDNRSVTHTVAVGGATTLTLLAELPDESTTVRFIVVGRRGGNVVGQGASAAIAIAPHVIADALVSLRGSILDGGGDAGGGHDLAASDGGGSDGGAVWTTQHGTTPPAGASITAIWGGSGSDVYATSTVAGGVNLWHTTDHGAHWASQLAGTQTLNGAGGSSAADVILVGDGATILRGSGTSWTPSSAPIAATTTLDAVFALSATDVYIAGSGNTILHSVTGGWVDQTAAGTDELHAIWGVAGHLWAVGSGGTILRGNGSGAWTPETSNSGAELRAVFGTSATDVWAAGDGVLLHSDGSGAWSDVTATIPSVTSLRALGGSGGVLFAVGSGWTILRHDAAGWTEEPSGLVVDDAAGDRLNAVFAPSAGDAYAGGDGQIILHR
jgi:hypothetical protein